MPRYFFDLKGDHGLIDPCGLVCASDADALDRAKTLAIGISLDKPLVDPGRRVSLRNDAGEEISSVPVYSTPSYENPAE
jgi:hypothetical protein